MVEGILLIVFGYILHSTIIPNGKFVRIIPMCYTKQQRCGIMTKRNAQMRKLYRFAKYRDIYDAYFNPNINKVNAFKRIQDEMTICGGYDLRITATTPAFFSCAYKVDTDSGTVLVYHGKKEVYRIPMEGVQL